jgi:hypothetical protein
MAGLRSRLVRFSSRSGRDEAADPFRKWDPLLTCRPRSATAPADGARVDAAANLAAEY